MKKMKKAEQLSISSDPQQSSVENQAAVSTPKNHTNTIAIPCTPNQPIETPQEPPNIKQQRREATKKAQEENKDKQLSRMRLGL